MFDDPAGNKGLWTEEIIVGHVCIAGSVIYAITSMLPGCARKEEWKSGTMVYSGPILRTECTVGYIEVVTLSGNILA